MVTSVTLSIGTSSVTLSTEDFVVNSSNGPLVVTIFTGALSVTFPLWVFSETSSKGSNNFTSIKLTTKL